MELKYKLNFNRLISFVCRHDIFKYSVIIFIDTLNRYFIINGDGLRKSQFEVCEVDELTAKNAYNQKMLNHDCELEIKKYYLNATLAEKLEKISTKPIIKLIKQLKEKNNNIKNLNKIIYFELLSQSRTVYTKSKVCIVAFLQGTDVAFVLTGLLGEKLNVNVVNYYIGQAYVYNKYQEQYNDAIGYVTDNELIQKLTYYALDITPVLIEIKQKQINKKMLTNIEVLETTIF